MLNIKVLGLDVPNAKHWQRMCGKRWIGLALKPRSARSVILTIS